jgi:hypothetical protein
MPVRGVERETGKLMFAQWRGKNFRISKNIKYKIFGGAGPS